MHRTNGSFLTRTELDTTIAEFEKEEAIWNQLQVGQVLFMEHGNGFDFDYFAHEIVEIDSANRLVTYKDLSQNGKLVTLERLQTIKELADRKVLSVRIDTTGYTDLQVGTV